MQVCTSLQTDNHANTSLLSFLQAGCPSCRPTNSVKALKANVNKNNVQNITFDLVIGHRKYYNMSDDLLTFDNAQNHVTAFRPVSEAARSWSDDSKGCRWLLMVRCHVW